MEAQLSDNLLVQNLQAGDLDALGELYERYKNTVYHTALAITHDPNKAEDILQECFLRLHRYAHSIKPNLPLKPWLYRVTVNLTYTLEKKRSPWQAPLDEISNWFASHPKNSPEWQVEMGELRSEVIEAVRSLGYNHRIVIILYYLNDLDLTEIAQILAIPIGTVKSRLHYGREYLRRKLTRNYGVTPDLAYTLLNPQPMVAPKMM